MTSSTSLTNTSTATNLTTSLTTPEETSVTDTSSSATTTTINAVNNIASDEVLAMWAVVDYQQKGTTKVGDIEIRNISDVQLEIILKDDNGKVLDTYSINPKTGEGTNSSNEAVNLPQTGNNSATNILIALAALMMIGLGLITIRLSGVRGRRINEK